MKALLSFLAMAISLQVLSQSKADEILGRKTLAGKVLGNEVHVVLDKDAFIKAANDAMYKGKPEFDGLAIERGETLGDKKLSYYCLLFFSQRKI